MSQNAPKFTAFQFDASQHEAQAAPGDTLPAGWYGIIISDAEIKAAKSAANNMRCELTHTVITGPYAGRTFRDGQNVVHSSAKTQKIGLGFMASLCNSIGVGGIQDLTQLLNRPLSVSVREVPAEGQYDAKNEVRGYKAWDESKFGPIPAGNWATGGGAPGFHGAPAGLPAGAPQGMPPGPPAGAPAAFAPPAPAGPQPWQQPVPGSAPAPAGPPGGFAPPAQPTPQPGPPPQFQAPAPVAAPFPPPTHAANPNYPGWYYNLADGSPISEQDLRAWVAAQPPAGVPGPAFPAVPQGQPPAGAPGFAPAPAGAPFSPPAGPPAPGSPSPWGQPPTA